jgi:hypothetical protein
MNQAAQPQRCALNQTEVSHSISPSGRAMLPSALAAMWTTTFGASSYMKHKWAELD